jgi:hypothetical protein
MGYFGECLITTIDFENMLKPVAKNKVLLYNEPTFFSWQALEPDKAVEGGRYRKLCEGLMVDSYYQPVHDLEPYKSSVLELGQHKFAFEYTYNSRGVELLYHLVLPEYCYLDEDEVFKMKNEDATIFTHERRQCITLAYDEQQKNLHIYITFTGPDKDKFNEIRNEPQPIIFTRSKLGVRKEGIERLL